MIMRHSLLGLNNYKWSNSSVLTANENWTFALILALFIPFSSVFIQYKHWWIYTFKKKMMNLEHIQIAHTGQRTNDMHFWGLFALQFSARINNSEGEKKRVNVSLIKKGRRANCVARSGKIKNPLERGGRGHRSILGGTTYPEDNSRGNKAEMPKARVQSGPVWIS